MFHVEQGVFAQLPGDEGAVALMLNTAVHVSCLVPSAPSKSRPGMLDCLFKCNSVEIVCPLAESIV